MGRVDESGQSLSFSWGKAARNSISSGVAAVVTGGLVAAQNDDPVIISLVVSVTFGSTVVGTFVGEFTNSIYDDPHPVFDHRTTVLFNLVGMIVCFFVFVVPAMILGALVTPGTYLIPGFFGYVAFGLSGFFVAIVRGLLVNLGLVHDENGDDLYRRMID